MIYESEDNRVDRLLRVPHINPSANPKKPTLVVQRVFRLVLGQKVGGGHKAAEDKLSRGTAEGHHLDTSAQAGIPDIQVGVG